MFEARFKRVHSDISPLLQRLLDILLSDTLNAKVLKRTLFSIYFDTTHGNVETLPGTQPSYRPC